MISHTAPYRFLQNVFTGWASPAAYTPARPPPPTTEDHTSPMTTCGPSPLSKAHAPDATKYQARPRLNQIHFCIDINAFLFQA